MNKCTCNAKPEQMGEGYEGKWHDYDCPMYDGDHPEIVDSPESSEKGSEKTTKTSESSQPILLSDSEDK